MELLRQEWSVEPCIIEEKTQKYLLVFVFTWTHHQDVSRFANLLPSFVYCVIQTLWVAGKRLILLFFFF